MEKRAITFKEYQSNCLFVQLNNPPCAHGCYARKYGYIVNPARLTARGCTEWNKLPVAKQVTK